MASTNNGSNGLKKIALDSNMLLSIEQFKIDVFEELKKIFGKTEFAVPIQVLNELDGLSKHGRTLKKRVEIAKILLEKNFVKKLNVLAENADDALLKLSKQGFIIATNDKELGTKIKNLSGQIIYLKKRKTLEMS